MKNRVSIITFALAVFAWCSAQASVALDAANFPDENLRNYASQYDEDGDGTLNDDELAQITEISAGDILNLKGAEHFKNLEYICLWYGSTEYPSIASIDPSLFPKLYRFSLQDCNGVTALDFSHNPLLTNFELLRCPNISSLQLPSSVEQILLDGVTKLTSLDMSLLSNLRMFSMVNSGITDLDFSDNSTLSLVSVTGSEDEKQELNSLNLENCDGLENIDIRYTTIKKLTMKHLPIVRTLMMLYNDITSTTIDDCAEFNDITCNDNVLGTLYLKNNPLLQAINTEDNQLKTFIADNCPKLGWVQAYNNRLMWLDLKDVVKAENDVESRLMVDNQQPTVQAVKISPTEVGLRVHERLDVDRVLNLRAKGIAQTPKEIFVDDIRYFVFYNNGADTPNLVGSDCYYEYDTKWPYPWVDGNSKDNNLPVTLNVTSWTKHPSWIRIDGETSIVVNQATTSLPSPTILRSQDYNGQLTYRSSDENVVKVNATTGEMTIVGFGTAVITITGAETDYRLAPQSITYTVVVTSPTGIDHPSSPITRRPSPAYDLQGRSVTPSSVQKGVYVVNGKKVVLK